VTSCAPRVAARKAATLMIAQLRAAAARGSSRQLVDIDTRHRLDAGEACARIALRPVTSGFGALTCLSKRPGRVRAASRESGALVAAITMMPSVGENPSISARSWFTVWRLEFGSRGLRFEPTCTQHEQASKRWC